MDQREGDSTTPNLDEPRVEYSTRSICNSSSDSPIASDSDDVEYVTLKTHPTSPTAVHYFLCFDAPCSKSHARSLARCLPFPKTPFVVSADAVLLELQFICGILSFRSDKPWVGCGSSLLYVKCCRLITVESLCFGHPEPLK
jgi:hypothetical protein